MGDVKYCYGVGGGANPRRLLLISSGIAFLRALVRSEFSPTEFRGPDDPVASSVLILRVCGLIYFTSSRISLYEGRVASCTVLAR